MRKALMVAAVLAIILLAWGTFAYAAQGGEGQNQTCNGQGNPSSPCVGQGGQGGNGGNGGNGGASTAVAVSATSARANATADGVYTGGNNATNVNVDARTSFERYAPGMAAPALTSAGTGVCLGSVSIGLSGPMAGASFGVTKVDKGCERRSGAALLYQMGYKDAAIRLLMRDEEIKEAMNPKPQADSHKTMDAVRQETDGTAFNYITTVEGQR